MRNNILLRISLLVVLFMMSLEDMKSQTMMPSQSYSLSDTIQKKILDNADFKVIYRFSRVINPDKPSGRKHGFSTLLIGDRYNNFEDYYYTQSDWIYDKCIKSGKSFLEILNDKNITKAFNKRIFYEVQLIDRIDSQITNQIDMPLAKKYEYKEYLPVLEWNLVEGDTVIGGYNCQKALTHFAGRDYEAWYTPEIDLPYGPYKFGGLPGLILQISDTKDHYEFTLYSFERLTGYNPIYIRTSNYHKGKRDKIRKIIKNVTEDPASGNENLQLEENAHLRAITKHGIYNPIELE